MSIMIDDRFTLKEEDIRFVYLRSSGPGGQKVNKTSTKVQLRFDIVSSSIPDDIKGRLRQLAGRRINDQGELVIEAQRFRTQAQNRLDAIERLVTLLRLASEKPELRVKTRPTLTSQKRRLETKRRRAYIKGLRRRPRSESDYS